MATQPRIGKHVLETLTVGMYTDPLSALREYVQNSCDAIEDAVRGQILPSLEEGWVAIELDGRARTIRIRDNGTGLRQQTARAALLDVGRSGKLGSRARGFRGIGRLGGLAYCRQLIFETKAPEDPRFYRQVWDCRRLHALLSPDDGNDLGVLEVIGQVCSDSAGEYHGEPSDHYFEVQMVGVLDDRLMDPLAAGCYLSQTAPVPFDYEAFACGREVHAYLCTNVPAYTVFHITLNKSPLFKPYRDTVPLSRAPNRPANSEAERILGITRLTLCGKDGDTLAIGWLANTELRGTVSPDCGMAGVRLRAGNMLVGDERTLEETFQKSNKRFAQYLVGEVHAVAPGLIPNARRDNFESNEPHASLLGAIARQIAEPESEKIREASGARSKVRRAAKADQVRQQAEQAVQKGFASAQARTELIDRLKQARKGLDRKEPQQQQQATLIDATLERVRQDALHVVDQELGHYPKRVRDLLKLVCSLIETELADGPKAEALIRAVVKKLSRVSFT